MRREEEKGLTLRAVVNYRENIEGDAGHVEKWQNQQSAIERASLKGL